MLKILAIFSKITFSLHSKMSKILNRLWFEVNWRVMNWLIHFHVVALCVTRVHLWYRLTNCQVPTVAWTWTAPLTAYLKSVIYAILCTKCSSIYIGKTGRCLGDRIREHLHHVRVGTDSNDIAVHFNSDGHDINDLSVLVIKSVFDISKRLAESKLIRLGTLHPLGLNRESDSNYKTGWVYLMAFLVGVGYWNVGTLLNAIFILWSLLISLTFAWFLVNNLEVFVFFTFMVWSSFWCVCLSLPGPLNGRTIFVQNSWGRACTGPESVMWRHNWEASEKQVC